MIAYSDVYVSILAKGLCHAGEKFVGACSLSHRPFWSFGAPIFRHAYLLVATTRRLIALDHRRGFVFERLDRADSWAWADVGGVRLGGFLRKKVVVHDRAGRALVHGKVTGFFGPMQNNGASARAIVQTWEMLAQKKSVKAGVT